MGEEKIQRGTAITTAPFSLTFEEFLKLEFTDIKNLYSQVYDSFKDKLERAWKKGIRHIVICNDRIVKESDEIEHISDEEIKQLGQEYNSACYVFSAPDFVEESTWHKLSPNQKVKTHG